LVGLSILTGWTPEPTSSTSSHSASLTALPVAACWRLVTIAPERRDLALPPRCCSGWPAEATVGHRTWAWPPPSSQTGTAGNSNTSVDNEVFYTFFSVPTEKCQLFWVRKYTDRKI
jgi:hypothetical protein